MAKMDLSNKARWWLTSNRWSYNCLLWPKPLGMLILCSYHGSRSSKAGWHNPRTLLWISPRTPMFLLSILGAKLNSMNASLVDTFNCRIWKGSSRILEPKFSDYLSFLWKRIIENWNRDVHKHTARTFRKVPWRSTMPALQLKSSPLARDFTNRFVFAASEKRGVTRRSWQRKLRGRSGRTARRVRRR